MLVGFIFLITFIIKSFKSQCPSEMTYDDTLKKCRKLCGSSQVYDYNTDTCLDCPIGQELVNGECVNLCPSGSKRCPTGTGCFIEGVTVCDDYGDSCPIQNLCQQQPSSGAGTDAPLKKKCCPADKYCDKTQTPNVCIKCPEDRVMCNGYCCDPDKDCWGNMCCDPANKGKTAQGIDICCTKPLCNGICCDTSKDEECNPDTNKCQVKCGDKFCSSNTPNCFVDDSQTPPEYSCFSANQCWGNIGYTPPLLTGKDGLDYKYNGDFVPLFLDTTSTTDPKAQYILPNKDGVKLHVEVPGYSWTASDICTPDTCKARISQEGVGLIKFDPVKTKTDKGYICSADIGKDSSSIQMKDMPTICNDIGSQRCCRTSGPNGDYTGQVCSSVNEKCWNLGNQYKCSVTDPLALPDGTVFAITGRNRKPQVLKTKADTSYSAASCSDVWVPYDNTKTVSSQMDHKCATDSHFTISSDPAGAGTGDNEIQMAVCGNAEQTHMCPCTNPDKIYNCDGNTNPVIHSGYQCVNGTACGYMYDSSDPVDFAPGMPDGMNY